MGDVSEKRNKRISLAKMIKLIDDKSSMMPLVALALAKKGAIRSLVSVDYEIAFGNLDRRKE